MTNLEVLNMRYNLLEGSIPSEIGGLMKYVFHAQYLLLVHCSWNAHQSSNLTNIPHIFVCCFSLGRIDLSENFFTGAVPSEFGLLRRLDDLRLNRNFLESLPDEIFTLDDVGSFDVSANTISGTLPSHIAQMKDTTWLSLYGNWFYGTLPSELGHLTDMVSLLLSYNYFSGRSRKN